MYDHTLSLGPVALSSRPAWARCAGVAVLAGALCVATAARAEEGGSAEGAGDAPAAKDAAADKGKEPEAAATDNAPLEKEGKAYRFVGLRFRDLIVPKFMIDLFAAGGSTVNVFTVGPEFTTRKDGFEIDLALSYADYSMSPTLFKGKNDSDIAWEIVSSSMKLVYFTTDLLYEIPLDKEKGRFSLLVGGGVGLGVVAGNLYRNQAYPNDPGHLNTSDVSAWQKCPGVGAGPSGGVYCDGSNKHYGSYSEPSWINGGSKPTVFPWISLPQLSFRWKPIKQLQTRLDTGFSISGFFFGMSAGYGL